MNNRYLEKDIRFLLETTDPSLLDRISVIKDDPDIIEGMMEHEAGRLFRRVMLSGEDSLATVISPRFLFEILLRNARQELETRSYTIERSAAHKIPVFDTPEVNQFLRDNSVLFYLADMLISFMRVESFTSYILVKKGIMRKVRFNDMDIDTLLVYCQSLDEGQRFKYYKRIADLCLFVSGMFPEYAAMDYRYPSSGVVRPKLFGQLRRSVEDYEEEGRRFYKLAGEHQDADTLKVTEPLSKLHENFHLAKKPLNYISEHYIQFKKKRLFPHNLTNQR